MSKLTLQQNSNEINLNELFEEFQRYNTLQNLSSETIKYYDSCYRYFTEFISEDISCSQISEDTFFRYLEYIKKNKPELKSASLRSYLTGLRAILYYGIKKGYIDNFQIQLPKMDEVVKQTYTDHEIILLLKKPDLKKTGFPEYRNWVLVNYMLGTGNRAGTIINLKIEDVNLNSGTIILKKLKSRKQYYIPISKSLEQVLREYLVYRKGEQDDALFCTIYGKPLTLNGLETEIARYNKSKGIEKTGLHMFRHTFAKQWILNGGDIFRLQKILGHSSLDMVRKYVNMFSDDLKRDFDSYKKEGFPEDVAEKYESQHLNQAICTIESLTTRMQTQHCLYFDSVRNILMSGL